MATKSTLKSMNRFQKVNHFPGCWYLGRKDNLWINLSKMKRQFQSEYDFVPNTYLLAYDYDRFINI
jgi:tubulin polyglutamylase TTLL4